MPSSFNKTINFNNKVKILDLNKLYDNFKLTDEFPKKSLQIGDIKKYKSIIAGKQTFFKNVMSITIIKNELKIPVKITQTGKIILAHVPFSEMSTIDDVIFNKLRDSGLILEKKKSTVNAIQDILKLPGIDIVDLDYLDSKLSKFNLKEYSFVQNNLSLIKFRYFVNGFQSSIMIFSKGKIMSHISFDTSTLKDIPNSIRATITDYVVNLVMPFMTKQSAKINLLDHCRKGQIYVKNSKGITTCKKPTKKDTEKLFTGVKDEYKGFNDFSKQDLEECISICGKEEQATKLLQVVKKKNRFLGNVPHGVIHYPLLKSNIPTIKKKWIVYGIPAGDYVRMRFYIDSNNESFFIDEANNFFKSNYPKTDEHDVVLDGYYSEKYNYFSPIDIIVHDSKLVDKLDFKKRSILRENVGKKFNMDSKFIALGSRKQKEFENINSSNLSKDEKHEAKLRAKRRKDRDGLQNLFDLSLNSFSGLVFLNTQGNYYDHRYSWKDVKTTLALYRDNSLFIGSEIFPGFSGYRNGEVVVIGLNNENQLAIFGKSNMKILDPDYSLRVVNSLINTTGIIDLFK